MIIKKDLSDLVLNKNRAGEYLYCSNCGGEYSASSGDYWNLADDYVFVCSCGHNLCLARLHRQVDIIKK